MIHDVRHMGKRVVEALPLGLMRVRRSSNGHAVEGAPNAGVREAVEVFSSRWGDAEAPADEPIFILSAGWRGGSSLLHRLVMSSGRAFLWGEPYHECGYVQRMAETLRAFGPDRPVDGVFHRPHANGNGQYADARIAYLFPGAEHLLAAHRAFFDRLLAQPAREGGFARWGLKAVRLSVEHAHYLRWLWPDAKLLFQVRNPYKAYRVYRIARGLFLRWPDREVLTASAFGAVWHELARGFVDEYEALRARLVRFERLAGMEPTLFEDLSDYLDLPLQTAVVERKLRERQRPLQAIPPGELEELRAAVEPLATELGYAPTLG